MRQKAKVLTLFIIFSLLFGLVPVTGTTVHAEQTNRTVGDISVTRCGGTNRFGTAAQLSQSFWGNEGSDYVVLANSESFADALAGGPLCAALDAPLLLTKANSLDTQTKTEITRLGATKAIVLGGEGAISASVANEVQRMGLNVERIGGINRYETCANVAKRIIGIKGYPRYIFFACANNYPDALSCAPVAAKLDTCILYAPADGSMNEYSMDVFQEIANHRSAEGQLFFYYVLGGPAIISESVHQSLHDAAPTYAEQNQYNRIYGNNRYETCYYVNDFFADRFYGIEAENTPNLMLVAGNNFPDALTGGAACARMNMPIALVHNNHEESYIDYLVQVRFQPRNVYIAGGTGVVSEETVNHLLTFERSEVPHNWTDLEYPINGYTQECPSCGMYR